MSLGFFILSVGLFLQETVDDFIGFCFGSAVAGRLNKVLVKRLVVYGRFHVYVFILVINCLPFRTDIFPQRGILFPIIERYFTS